MIRLGLRGGEDRQSAREAYLRLVATHSPEVDAPGWVRACSAYCLVDAELRAGRTLPAPAVPVSIVPVSIVPVPGASDLPPIDDADGRPAASSPVSQQWLSDDAARRMLPRSLWEARSLVREGDWRAGVAAFASAINADRAASPGESPDRVLATLAQLTIDRLSVNGTAIARSEVELSDAVDAVVAWVAHHGPEFRLLDHTTAPRWVALRNAMSILDLLPTQQGRMLMLAIHYDGWDLYGPTLREWHSSHPATSRRIWHRFNASKIPVAPTIHQVFGLQRTYGLLTSRDWILYPGSVLIPGFGAIVDGWTGLMRGLMLWVATVALWWLVPRVVGWARRLGRGGR